MMGLFTSIGSSISGVNNTFFRVTDVDDSIFEEIFKQLAKGIQITEKIVRIRENY